MALPLLPRHDHASCHRHGNGHGDFTVPARWTPQTVNNDNSSRFAKCMQVSLDDQGRVIGAKIETSLLEKSRTCAFFRWERNFHIFYMLCYYRHSKCRPEPGEQQDTDNSDAAELLGPKAYKYLLTADSYDFTATGDTEKDEEGPYSGPGHSYRTRFQASDIDWFKKVMSAFRNSLGYTADETNQMMELLTAILHMGNIKFAEGDKSQVFLHFISATIACEFFQ